VTSVRRPYDALKRFLDAALAVGAIGLSSPIWLAVAIAIKRDSAGPIFYRGVRVGRGGVPFRMFKFRTMVAGADRTGVWSTAAGDPRITRVGRTLRAYKLDELPNLLNVLRGDMSLVGPRPQVPADVAKYTDDERALLDVRPGVTDYASIRFRNEADILEGHADPDAAYDRLIRPEKSRLGLEYVRTRSLWVDLRILWDFVRVLLKLPGAPPPAEVRREGTA
jgi:lipopolysaccharide/colanic/teichoic acid biosynthesis glycosyltransferase